VRLPLGIDDPVERLRAVNRETLIRKEEHDAEQLDHVAAALGRHSARLAALVERIESSPREFAVNVSNVPGPRIPVWLRGCELREAVPVIPLADGHALSIGIFSYADRITFGAYADPHALPQVAELPLALCAAVLDVCALAAPTRRRRQTLRAVS